MSDRDDLRAELAVAKAQGRGTDAGRIKKQLAAIEPVAPTAPPAEAKSAASARAGAAESPAEAPKGRTTARDRQHRT